MKTSRLANCILLFLFLCLAGTATAQDCSINAGVDVTICANGNLTLTGLLTTKKAINTTIWKQIEGTTVTIGTPSLTLTSTPNTDGVYTHKHATAITGFAASTGTKTYKFLLSSTCLDGSTITDQVTVTVQPILKADAGLDQLLCPGTGSLNANAPVPGSTGSWSTFWPNNANISLTNSYSPTSSFTLPNDTAGSVTLRWTIVQTTNGTTCTSTDDVVISNRGGVSPVDAGPDQTLSFCYSGTTGTQLVGSFGGKGIGGQGGTWTKVSGPSAVSFSNANSQVTGVTGLIAGVYVFRWTVSGPCVTGSDEVQVTVPQSSGLTVASISGGSQPPYCDGRTSVVLTGNSPLNAGEAVQWTQVSGPSGPVITTPTSATTTITGLNGSSTYMFQYRIYNAATGCVSATATTVSYTQQPTISVNGGVDNIYLACNDTTASIPYTFTGGTATWYRVISGPAGYTLPHDMTSSSSPQPITGLSVPGTYVVRFRRVGSGCVDAYDDVNVIVSRGPSAANAGTSQLLACNVFATALAGNVPSIGKGTWSQVSGPNTASIANPGLYNTGISGLTNGAYSFKWIISGGTTCAASESVVTVRVASTAPTQADAGADRTVCHSTPTTLAANAAILNETGTWTVSPSAGVSFSNVNAHNAIVTGLSANTAYTFTWTITNACGTSSDNVVITTSGTAGPAQANAGLDLCLNAGTTSATLGGNNPTPPGATGLWTQISGPTTASFTNKASYNSGLSGLANGTYQFVWTLGLEGCSTSSDTMLVTVSPPVTTAAAGPDQLLCAPASGTINSTLTANSPAVGTGTWIQVAGPGGAVIAHPALPSTTVAGLAAGDYTFRWIITNGGCTSSSDDVVINVSAPPSTADAGPDKLCVTANNTTLAASVPTSGTGIWSTISGPNAPDINTPSAHNTRLSNLINGVYMLRWTVAGGPGCVPSTDDLKVTVNMGVYAGKNDTLCSVSTVSLSANPSAFGTWSQVSGPNSAVISHPGSPSYTASATGLIPGTYIFRYTGLPVESCTPTSSTKTVLIYAGPTEANAGPDQTLCSASSFVLTANTPVWGTGTWTKVSGPEGGSFSPSTTAPNAVFTGAGTGIYQFAWTIATGKGCSSTDQVMITNEAPPSPANAGPDQSFCAPTTNLVASAPGTGIGIWTQVSGPSTALISNPYQPATAVGGLADGLYTFRWTVSNGSCPSSSDDVQIAYCLSLLPVKFVSVGATREGNNILVQWTVSEEQNVKHYEVERSSDGSSFAKMGQVAYKQPAGTKNQYGFTDQTPAPAVVYYRIRQVDADGGTVYSKTVSVAANSQKGGLFLSPNPVTAQTTVVLEAAQNQQVSLFVADVQGRTLVRRSLPVQKGRNVLPAEFIRTLPGGYYLLVAEVDGQLRQVKFIK